MELVQLQEILVRLHLIQEFLRKSLVSILSKFLGSILLSHLVVITMVNHRTQSLTELTMLKQCL
ncbi:Protein of unknown function [Cotesia congregata]|uniref:Uncharacterized protein n=1 Tax=Cotesia congregata TaxID=51543 RepID=A0A8J2EDV2_COTCN|nr:Protein of unknown function [Cotesia congregata]